ncbi:MAG: hypothetical protein IIB75_11590 [Proteobacteria bacterium]|nr:hypothetical protein [Pseudomonadota bacterium]
MPDQFDTPGFTANDMRIALNEIYPDSTYGAVPVIDQYDALEAYLAFDDGALAEAPQALAAYIDHQQHFGA